MVFRFFSVAAVGFLLGSGLLQAQPYSDPTDPSTGGDNRQLIDGIAAIVGNEVILISDVVQRAFLLSRQEQGLNPSDPQLNQEILNNLIMQKLILVRATQDSIGPTRDQIQAESEARVSELVRRAGSESILEQQYGMSMATIRREVEDAVEDELKVMMLRRQKFADLKVTERDIDVFYRSYRDSLPEVGEQYELAHIVVKQEPTSEARSAAIARAEAIADSLRAGASFEDLAARHSIDPGSRRKGGDLGYFTRGKLVPEFEKAAWNLEPGMISSPVITKFGAHVIEVLDVRGEERHIRHILLPIESDPTLVRDSLLSLKGRAAAGESFADLARQYSADAQTGPKGGRLGTVTLDELPPSLADVVPTMTPGEITDPLQVQISPTESAQHIVKLVRVLPPHRLDPVEDRERFQQVVTNWKQDQLLMEWLAELQEEIYWAVKYDFTAAR